MEASCSKTLTVPDVKYWRITQSKLHKVDLVLTINEISNLNYSEEYESPQFYGGSKNLKFCFVLKRVKYEFFEMKLKLLQLQGSSNDFVSCKYRLTALNYRNENTNKIIAERICNCLDSLESDYVSIKYSTDFFRDNITNDKFGMLCEVEFVTDVDKHFTAQILAQNSSLGDHFGKLLDSQMFSDIKLVVGEKEFPVHKIILAVRSEVFAAMFQHEMKEAKSGQVLLTDVKPEVVEEMLRFIYTGESPNIKNLADELLVIANKYALKDLLTMAEVELVTKLSVNTAIDTLILADRHNAEFLKRETINFINVNATEVIKTDDWQTTLISHPVLIRQIYEANFMIWNVLPCTESLFTSTSNI